MGNVMVIPAKRKIGNTNRKKDTKPKLRVAAYCRVSTDSDEQATSYEAQVEHYTEYIKRNPDWEFAGIYTDDGISGTNTKNREEFNRLIKDCETGSIDMVITKELYLRCRAKYSPDGNPSSVALSDNAPTKLVAFIRRIPKFEYDIGELPTNLPSGLLEIAPTAKIWNTNGMIDNPACPKCPACRECHVNELTG